MPKNLKQHILLAAVGAMAWNGARLAAAKPLVMQLDLGVRNVQFAGLNWAESHGWFKEAGIDVAIRRLPKGYGDLAETVAQTLGGIGSIESGLFLAARAKGLPVVAIGTMFQASPLCLISPAELGIRTPKDLVGKRAAVHGDGYEALATVLATAGVDPSLVTLVEAEYGNVPLLRGEMDAKQGYWVDEFVKLQTEGHDVTAIPLREYGHVAYSQVFFVSETTLRERRADIVKSIAVANRGWVAALADIPTAAKLTVADYEPQLGLDYQIKSLTLIYDLVWAESPMTASMSTNTWSSNAESFLSTHQGAELPPMAQWTDFQVAVEAGDGR